MDKTFISLLSDFIEKYGKDIMDHPDKFRALVLDFTKNDYKAETMVFCQFLSSNQITDFKNRVINEVSELNNIADRFHQSYLFDKNICETTILAYAYFQGIISNETMQAEISKKSILDNNDQSASTSSVQKPSETLGEKLTIRQEKDVITLASHGWVKEEISKSLKVSLEKVERVLSTNTIPIVTPPPTVKKDDDDQTYVKPFLYDSNTGQPVSSPSYTQPTKKSSSGIGGAFGLIIVAIIVIIFIANIGECSGQSKSRSSSSTSTQTSTNQPRPSTPQPTGPVRVEFSNRAIANAKVGDYTFRPNGERIDLKQADIDYARRQMQGQSTTSRPSTPTNLQASDITSTTCTLKFNSVSGATGYYVYWSSSATGTYSRVGNNTSNSTTRSITNMSRNATHYFKVSSFNSAGESAQSQYIWVKTNP